MGTVKRDGFYKRGRYWWTRHPATKERCSTGQTDLEAARRWRAAEERNAADPAYAASELATLGDWCGRFVAMKEKTKSEATADVARTKLGHWVRIFGDAAPLAIFDAGAFDRFVDQRRDEKVTDHTISKEVSHLLAVLKLAKRGKCFAGDISTLRPPDLHAGYDPKKRALTREELVRLLAQLEPRRAALVAVCVALGCRLGEAFRLLPTDFDAERGRVFVRGTKTKASERYIPLLSLFRGLFEAALPYLPLERWGKVQRDLKAACARAGILPCSPNDLRRTHATLLAEAGVDADVTRRLLGHTTRHLVDRVYGQPSTEALAELAEAKLLLAPPLLVEYNDVTIDATQDDKNANTASAPVAQWTEQRFPKPEQDLEESAEDPPLRGNHAASAITTDRDAAYDPVVSRTRTSQRAEAFERRHHMAAQRSGLARQALLDAHLRSRPGPASIDHLRRVWPTWSESASAVHREAS